MADADKRERLEEEFELGDEAEAIEEYSYITSVIAVNYSLMADELSKLLSSQEGLGLDLGCGLGDLAIEVGRRYSRMDITGIDISPEALARATEKAKGENLNNVRFQLTDVHYLPFIDSSYDLAVSHGSIHHWKNPSRAFGEIYRVLKTGGLAYLSDLRRDAPEQTVKDIEKNLPSSQAKGFINSVRASYVPEELKEMLSGAGIKSFEVSGQKFSRDTIFKNMEKLRGVAMRSADYPKLSQTIIIRK